MSFECIPVIVWFTRPDNIHPNYLAYKSGFYQYKTKTNLPLQKPDSIFFNYVCHTISNHFKFRRCNLRGLSLNFKLCSELSLKLTLIIRVVTNMEEAAGKSRNFTQNKDVFTDRQTTYPVSFRNSTSSSDKNPPVWIRLRQRGATRKHFNGILTPLSINRIRLIMAFSNGKNGASQFCSRSEEERASSEPNFGNCSISEQFRPFSLEQFQPLWLVLSTSRADEIFPIITAHVGTCSVSEQDLEQLRFPLEQQALAGSARFFPIGTTFRPKSLKDRSFLPMEMP